MNEASILQNPPMSSTKESTKASRASGLAYFTRFCIEAFSVQSLDEISETNLCDTVMLYSFCTYLIGLTKMNDGEAVSLKIGTLWQYLGAAVTYLKGSSLAAALAIQARMLDNLAVKEGRLPGQSTKAQASVSTIRKRLSKKP